MPSSEPVSVSSPATGAALDSSTFTVIVPTVDAESPPFASVDVAVTFKSNVPLN